MNFLAHLYLSGKDKNGVLVGNFIADQVKGKQLASFPENMQRGIRLHRKIDEFTDSHEVTARCKKRLRPVCGRYSGVFLDVIFDHFLAVEWERYSSDNLERFCNRCYLTLLLYWFRLPAEVKDFLPFIVFRRRLTKYLTLDGVQESFEIMSRHTSLPKCATETVNLVRDNYEAFRNDFNLFFPEMINFVENIRADV